MTTLQVIEKKLKKRITTFTKGKRLDLNAMIDLLPILEKLGLTDLEDFIRPYVEGKLSTFDFLMLDDNSELAMEAANASKLSPEGWSRIWKYVGMSFLSGSTDQLELWTKYAHNSTESCFRTMLQAALPLMTEQHMLSLIDTLVIKNVNLLLVLEEVCDEQ